VSLREDAVRSSDGTVIGWYERGTSGSPILLVHGSRTDAADWDAVSQLLAERHRVVAVDRRGRGRSGDGSAYTLELEADDVSAVAAGLGPDLTVVGHSMGGHIVLRACLQPPGFARVVVYEPSIPNMRPPIGPPRDEALAICRHDDPEESLLAFLRGVIGMPEPSVDSLRRRPSWGRRVALFPTYLRELDALEQDGTFDHDRIDCPVLVLIGSETVPSRWKATEALAASIPGASVRAIAGQQHDALRFAPEAVAAAVEDFISD
jgi:pimeloyl-ACP methyl ester carboxylesterase